MKARIIAFIDLVRGNYLFLPGALILIGIVLAYMTIQGQRIGIWVSELKGWPVPVLTSPEATRAVLATIATSMITIASLVFSLTIVALTLASQQFGPRMIRNFMSDRFDQFCLGAFVGTFLYCLVLLHFDNSESDPALGLFIAIILAILCCITLVAFIHHLAKTIQAHSVIRAVANELQNALADQQWKDSEGENAEFDLSELENADQCIPSPRSGYLQVYDVESLLKTAHKHDAFIRCMVRPGQFVFEGSDLIRVYGEELEDDTIRECQRHVAIGSKRTVVQDPEFPLMQLVEIALRALSSGINDPFTAIQVINQLGDGLRTFAERGELKRIFEDEEEEPRLALPTSTYEGFCDSALNQIRQSDGVTAAVLIAALDTLMSLLQLEIPGTAKIALRHHAELIYGRCQETISQTADLEAVEERMNAIDSTR